MKIGIQHVLAAEENSPGGELVKVWNNLLRRNIDLVKSEDTEVTFHTPKWGVTGLDPFFYTYLHRLNDSETLHGLIQIEKKGFDVAWPMCWFDPVLREARQALNIPVVGPAESSMLLAMAMGAKFGIVTISPEAAYDMEEEVLRYGFRERSVRIRPIPATAEEQIKGLTDAHHEIECFKEVARELIADGAEILIPGCTLMAPVLRLAPGAEDKYPNGLTEVDGVPVMDVIGATVKMAEVLYAFKKAGSTWISRKGFYARPTDEALKMAEMVLKYDRPGSWAD